MKDLSVIIPYVQEFPQVAFTVNNIYCELADSGIDFEIIVIDNWCKEVEAQGKEQDRGSKYMSELATASRPWLKYAKFEEKLSHWNAKNVGVAMSEGKILWFCDSHCIVSKNSLVNMYRYYEKHHEELNGTLHMPLSYMLEKDGLELIYKLIVEMEKAVVHYSFTRYRREEAPYQVPCMSTCGMMMTRDLYDLLGGWPSAMGIYGGGENFINFTLAVLGKTVNIFPARPLYHYAAPRGYYYNYDDFHRNRTIASLMYGGRDFARKYIMNVRGKPLVLEKIYTSVLRSSMGQRDKIKQNQVITIEDWVEKNKPG